MLATERVVGPGELAPHIRELRGRRVEANVPLVVGHEISSLDGLPIAPLKPGAREPMEGPACVIAQIDDDGVITVLAWSWTGEPRPRRVPRVEVSALHKSRNEIVEIASPLRNGAYWPVVGADYDPVTVVPPEIATTDRAYLAYGRADPPPAELTAWRARLANGPITVRARGAVLWQHFSAYELEVLG